MNEQEKTELRLALMEAMSTVVDNLPENHGIGYVPYEISTLMADAALNVLLTIRATNDYFETEKPPL